MTKILVTGSGGFLGSVFKDQLEEQGKIVFTLSRSAGQYQYDLSRQIPRFEESFDLVIHAAGKAHAIPINKQEEKEFYDVNLDGTKNLIAGLEKSRLPKSLIFISTVSVYGEESGVNISEDHILNGISPYADSKKKAERFLIEWGKSKGVSVGILRLPLVVGPNPPGNLGAMIKGIGTGKYLGISGNESRKSMVTAKDIVTILEPLAVKGGIYNLTDGLHPKISQLEEVIVKVSGRRLKRISGSFAKMLGWMGDIIGPKFPVNSSTINKLTSILTFSDKKARLNLGWNPTSVLEYFPEILK